MADIEYNIADDLSFTGDDLAVEESLEELLDGDDLNNLSDELLQDQGFLLSETLNMSDKIITDFTYDFTGDDLNNFSDAIVQSMPISTGKVPASISIGL